MARRTLTAVLLAASGARGVAGTLFCGARYYASADGLSCEPCPANSARLLDDPATAVGAGSRLAECTCEAGFYAPALPRGATGGAACVACPPGGICDGRAAPPRAARGFWRLAVEVQAAGRGG